MKASIANIAATHIGV